MKHPLVSTAVICILGGLIGGLLAGAFFLWMVGARGDWSGFMGGVIGGAMTLLAGFLAFGLTRRQVDMQAAELAASREAEERRAETLLELVVAAASHIIADVKDRREDADIPWKNGHLPIERAIMIASISDRIGYGELWRLDRVVVRKINLLDISINSLNTKINDARHVSMEYISAKQYRDNITEITESVRQLIVAIDPELEAHANFPPSAQSNH